MTEASLYERLGGAGVAEDGNCLGRDAFRHA